MNVSVRVRMAQSSLWFGSIPVRGRQSRAKKGSHPAGRDPLGPRDRGSELAVLVGLGAHGDRLGLRAVGLLCLEKDQIADNVDALAERVVVCLP